jgi:hypothetical protein
VRVGNEGGGGRLRWGWGCEGCEEVLGEHQLHVCMQCTCPCMHTELEDAEEELGEHELHGEGRGGDGVDAHHPTSPDEIDILQAESHEERAEESPQRLHMESSSPGP